MIDDLSRVPTSDFNVYGRQESSTEFKDQERALVEALAAVVKPGQRLSANEYEMIFLYRST